MIERYLVLQNTECSDGESTQRFLTYQVHCVLTKLTNLATCWPVLVAALLLLSVVSYIDYPSSFTKIYPSIFFDVREHDYSSTLPVIEDLQHVSSSGCHWTLSYDVSLLMLVTLMKLLYVASSDIFCLLICVLL